MNNDLLKCPFCGGDPKATSNPDIIAGRVVERHRIFCTTCGCTTPTFESLVKAIEKWQARVGK